jgi:hypothetical protein
VVGTVEVPQKRENAIASSPVQTDARGQSVGNESAAVDVIEAALADALRRAAAAQQWTTVDVLSRELQARREARGAVVNLDVERAKRRQ